MFTFKTILLIVLGTIILLIAVGIVVLRALGVLLNAEFYEEKTDRPD